MTERPQARASNFGNVRFQDGDVPHRICIPKIEPKIKFLFQPELKGKVDTSQFENFSCATIDDSPPDETSGWDNEF